MVDQPARKKETKRNRIPRATLDQNRQGSFSKTPTYKKSLQSYKNEKIVFSWKFFDKDHEAFNCGNSKVGWFINLMETMKHISEMTLMEYIQCTGKPLRVHNHKWSDVAFTFEHLKKELREQIENDTTQFALSTSGGRVHGFLIENLLFVVWLDPEHNLYPGDRDPRCYEPPLSPYEELLCNYNNLLEENQMLLRQKEEAETQLLECWESQKN
ncbi:hypothetical protein [Paenibacillus humicus]|uniref:hypothetical protein n=1 Tax=Paenibacillus humicus TaxID=412861 RepID=UPI003D27347A